MGLIYNLFSAEPLVQGLLLTCVLLILWVLFLTISNFKLRKSFNVFMQGEDGKSIENKVENYMEETEQHKLLIEELNNKLENLNIKNNENIQKVGITRFSAFTGVGGDLSFALALLDNRGKGVIISSIYGRDDNRMYAKPIEDGKSAYRLSSEEESALKKALGN